MAAAERVAPPPPPSRAAYVRAVEALKFFSFVGEKSERTDAEVAVARAIDEAVTEARESTQEPTE